MARWGWSGGGGHFVVGHGVQGDNIYYMNPWFGEGLLIGTYSWFKQGKTSNSSTHTWTDTNKLTGTALGVDESTSAEPISVSPNPFVYETTLRSDKNFNAATLTIYNALGQEMKQIKNISDQTVTIHRDNLPRGMYFIRVTEGNKTILTDKLLVTD